MDIGKLDTVAGAEQGFELELVDPSDMSNTGVFILVLGRDSKAYRDLLGEQSRKRVAKAQKLGSTRLNMSLDDLERETIELLAAATRSWRTTEPSAQPDVVDSKPVLVMNGEELACTRNNAITVYTKYPWIREQVDAAVVDRANFLRR